MAHKSSWIVDKRIMLLEYEGNVDKNEIRQLNEELESFLNEGQSPIHIISDNSNMGKAAEFRSYRHCLRIREA